MSLIERLFGNSSDRMLKKIRPIQQKVLAIRRDINDLQSRIADGTATAADIKFLNEKSRITVIFWPVSEGYPNGLAHFIITTTVDTANKNYDATIDFTVK